MICMPRLIAHLVGPRRYVVEGYASVFGERDMQDDVFVPGAFARSLAERPIDQIKMLWVHDPLLPIGRWLSAREDDFGLRVTGLINSETSCGRDVLALLRSGDIDGLSAGFKTLESRRGRQSGLRELIDVDLQEISITPLPAQPRAKVIDVRRYEGAA